MNMLQNKVQAMRIIALPLARAKGHPEAKLKTHSIFNANRMLVFYHFDLLSPNRTQRELSWGKRLLKSVSEKASNMWARLGKAPEGSWKLRTYELGERIADRIDFEELALKSVEPSLGPAVPLTAAPKQDEGAQKNSDQFQAFPMIPLVYPPSVYSTPPVNDPGCASHPSLVHLQTLVESCAPRHRRGFYLWMLLAPLTTPIILIPLIPNLPFFFCVWRSWSHYRAYRSSRYLSSLLDHGLIQPEPSSQLDELYALSAFTRTSSSGSRTLMSSEEKQRSRNPGQTNAVVTSEVSPSSSSDHHPSDRILLTRKAIPRILEMFSLPESAAADMYRAVEQVRGRLKSSR